MGARRGPPLVLGNDDRALALIETLDTANPPDMIPATGLTDITVRWSLTETGAAVHASLQKTAAELGNSGYYTAVMAGADLDTHLGSYVGQTVYRIWANAGNNIKNRVTAHLVVAAVGPA